MYIALGMLVFFAHWSSLPPEVVLDICGSTYTWWMNEWVNEWMNEMKLTRTNSHSSPFSRCERWGQERCCEAPTSQSSVSPTGSHAHPLSPWASVFLFFDHTLLASLATDITQQVCHCRCGLSSVKGFPVEGVCVFFTYHLDVYIHSVFALAGQHSCLSARGPCCVFSSLRWTPTKIISQALLM